MALGVLGGVLAAPVALAQESPFVFGPEEIVPKSVKPGEKWKEGDVQLPAWPRDNNLVEVQIDQPDDRFTYLIDQASLETGDDGVVRYTLIAETSSGARNISFEGIRCTPRGAFRTYAFGHGGSFQITEVAADWQPVLEGGAVRRELWRHYLCVPRLFEARPRRDQLRMLRSGRTPEIENRGFLTN
jgi:hypothetical protein